MNEYLVKYITTAGQICGIRVFANSMADAESQARSMPNFALIANTPEKIS